MAIRKVVSALVAPLAVFGSVTVRAAEVLEYFPNSYQASTGSWTHMRTDGFTGSFTEACDLLNFTAEQCQLYERMHENGSCQMMQVPNGVVLDALTFTRNNRHQVDTRVAVALEDPPSRDAEVCDLGMGVYAIRFLGCNNHARVDRKIEITRGNDTPALENPLASRTPPPEPVFNPGARQQQCPMITTPRIYEPRAAGVDGVREILAQIDETGGKLVEGAKNGSTDGDGSEAERISRRYGASLNAMYRSGGLALSSSPHHISMVLERPGQPPQVFFDGEVTGEQRVRLPEDFRPGDKIVTRFYDYSSIQSPSIHGLHSWYEEFQECKTNIQSMIER